MVSTNRGSVRVILQIGQSIKPIGALGIDGDEPIVSSLFLFAVEQAANKKDQIPKIFFESS